MKKKKTKKISIIILIRNILHLFYLILNRF